MQPQDIYFAENAPLDLYTFFTKMLGFYNVSFKTWENLSITCFISESTGTWWLLCHLMLCKSNCEVKLGIEPQPFWLNNIIDFNKKIELFNFLMTIMYLYTVFSFSGGNW